MFPSYGDNHLDILLERNDRIECYLGRRAQRWQLFFLIVESTQEAHNAQRIQQDLPRFLTARSSPYVHAPHSVETFPGKPCVTLVTYPYFFGVPFHRFFRAPSHRRTNFLPQPWSIERAVSTIWQLCEAINHLCDVYGDRYVHGSIDPLHVLCTPLGRTKLQAPSQPFLYTSSPFNNNTLRRHESILASTRLYDSPEHTRGSRLQPQSDVYQLGLLLYIMTTGAYRTPLDSIQTELEMIALLYETEVIPPSMHNASYPRALEDIVLCALAQTAEPRYRTVKHFQRNLEQHFGKPDLPHLAPTNFNAVLEWLREHLQRPQPDWESVASLVHLRPKVLEQPLVADYITDAVRPYLRRAATPPWPVLYLCLQLPHVPQLILQHLSDRSHKTEPPAWMPWLSNASSPPRDLLTQSALYPRTYALSSPVVPATETTPKRPKPCAKPWDQLHTTTEHDPSWARYCTECSHLVAKISPDQGHVPLAGRHCTTHKTTFPLQNPVDELQAFVDEVVPAQEAEPRPGLFQNLRRWWRNRN